MVRFGRVRLGSARTRVAIASWLVLALVIATLAVFALRSRGVDTHKSDLNDGGIWISRGAGAPYVGRDDKALRQIDLSIPLGGAGAADVLQDGSVVVSRAGGTLLSPVNLRTGQGGEPATVEEGADVGLGGGVIATVSKEGKVYGARVGADEAPSLGVLSGGGSTKPLVTTGGATRLAVSQAGHIAAVTPKTLTRISPTTSGFGKPVTTQLKGGATSVVAVTFVGSTPVWLDDAGHLTTPDRRLGTVPDGAMLQQPGPDSDRVLVETPTELLGYPLGGGDRARIAQADATGKVSRPVEVAGCAWGMWNLGATGQVAQWCHGDDSDAGKAHMVEIPALQPNAELVWRVNRNALLANDVNSGDAWQVDGGGDTAIKTANWQSLTQKAADDRSDNIDQNQPHQKMPPQAVDDQLGARVGATTVLHVLDNDKAPAGDVLVITSAGTDFPKDRGTVQVAPDQQSLLVTLNGSAGDTQIDFHYKIDDGESNGKATAEGVVHLRPHRGADAGQAEPKPRDNFDPTKPTDLWPVAAGESIEVPVLSDWRDPTYGDPLSLASVSTDTGHATVTSDGTLRYSAPDLSAKQTDPLPVRVNYTVGSGSGGRSTIKGSLKIEVDAGFTTHRPKALADAAAGQAGSPIVVHPLDNDIPGASPREPGAHLMLATVGPAPGVKTSFDSNAGVATLTAAVPGSYLVPYTAQYGGSGGTDKTGVIRLLVSAPAKVSDEPVPVPDSTTVHGDAPMLVDVLANDYDPHGGMLTVSEAEANNVDGLLTADVVDGRWIRVQSVSGDFGDAPEIVTYTVTNGIGSATSTLSVAQEPALDPSQDAPITEADTAATRAGSSVAIPVLANDSTPSGAPLGLVTPTGLPGALKKGDLPIGQLPVSGAGGTAYVSGRSIRYIAPPKVGKGATATITYTVANLAQPLAPVSTGEVTVRVTPEGSLEGDTAPTPSELTARLGPIETITMTLPSTGQDPDGDMVTIEGIGDAAAGTGMPQLGSIVDIGAQSITYQAFPGVSGTDVFNFTVRDQWGKTAVGTAEVAVAEHGAQPPVVVDDQVTADPQRDLSIPVLDNDIYNHDTPPKIVLDEPIPDGVTLTDTGRVEVPAQGGKTSDLDVKELRIGYSLNDGFSDPSHGYLVVDFQDGYDNPPTAGAVVAEVPETGLTATADVLKQVADVDDSTGLTLVSVDPLTGVAAPTITGGLVELPVSETPQVWTYHVADPAGAVGVGAIYVAGAQRFRPTLKQTTVTVDMGKSATLDLKDYVQVKGDPSAQITLLNPDTVGVEPKTLASPTDVTASSMTVKASDTPGEGTLSFQVQATTTAATTTADPSAAAEGGDGAAAAPKPNVVMAMLALHLIVKDPSKDWPDPKLNCSTAPIKVAMSGAATVDVNRLCHVWHASGDDRDFQLETKATGSHPDLDIKTDGSRIGLTAHAARAGATGSVAVSIKGFDAKSSVRYVVTTLPPPVLRAVPNQSAHVGRALSIDFGRFLASGSLAPRDVHPTIVSLSGNGPAWSGGGTKRTLKPAKVGSFTYSIVMADDGDKSKSRRTRPGRFTVTVTDKPSVSGAPTVKPGNGKANVNLSSVLFNANGLKITDYKVKTSGPGGGVTDFGGSTSGEVVGLQNGASYTFQAQACNADGCSAWSSGSSTLPDSYATAVQNLHIAKVGDGTATFEWTAPSGSFSEVTGYGITGPAGSLPASVVSTTSVRLTGLTNGAPVQITVTPINDKGASPDPTDTVSSPAAIPSGKPEVPGTPTVNVGASASGGAVTVTISWNAVAPNGRGATYYQVLDGGSAISCGGQAWVSATSCSVQQQTGTSHSVAVRASNESGASPNPAIGETVAADYISAASGSTTYSASAAPDSFSAPSLDGTGTAHQAKVTVTVGASNGSGGVLTCVEYTCDPVTIGKGGGSTTLTVTNAPDGPGQQVTVKYCNGDKSQAGVPFCTSAKSQAGDVWGAPTDATLATPTVDGRTVTLRASVITHGSAVSWRITRDGSNNWSVCGGRGDVPSKSDSVSTCTATYAGDWATEYTFTLSVTDESGHTTVAVAGSPATVKTDVPHPWFTPSKDPDARLYDSSGVIFGIGAVSGRGTFTVTYGELGDDQNINIDCLQGGNVVGSDNSHRLSSSAGDHTVTVTCDNLSYGVATTIRFKNVHYAGEDGASGDVDGSPTLTWTAPPPPDGGGSGGGSGGGAGGSGSGGSGGGGGTP